MARTIRYVVVALVAFVLGGLSSHYLGYAQEQKGTPSGGAETRQFAIEGMTCQGCVDTITQALTKLPGMQSAKVSLDEKKAVVVADPAQVPNEKIEAAIVAAGYQGHLLQAGQTMPSEHAMMTKPSAKQAVMVNITRGKNELHAVSMGLGLAQSALKDGRKAVVFLNVDAPVFAAKALGDDVKFADFPPVRKMLADFIAAGGQVLVCQHCAHVVKLNPEDLIGGVSMSEHGSVLATLTPGMVVFSY
ncbi:MAG: cation transporter [Thermoguttaceae bacterium]|jgi:copper chaperone CopZ/predicted peroxiredoxin